MNKTIFDIRFWVPPTLTLILVFLFSPRYFFTILSNYHDAPLMTAVLAMIILAMGVFISGAVEWYMRIYQIREWDYSNWSDNEKEVLNNLLEKNEPTILPVNRVELGTWLLIGDWNNKYKNIEILIKNRWNWATANSNLFASALFALAFIVFIAIFRLIPPEYPRNFISIIACILCSFVFGFNAKASLNSTQQMHQALFTNYEKLAGLNSSVTQDKDASKEV